MYIEYQDRKFEIEKDNEFYYLLEIEPPCNDRKLWLTTSDILTLFMTFCRIIGL